GGSCSSERVRSIACSSRALPSDPRCERPSADVSSLSGVQPGGLAQGPEEKLGRAGRASGFEAVIIITLLAESTRCVGTPWPADGCSGSRRDGNGRRECF